MSDLTNRIREARIVAAENVVVEHLRELGLMSEGPIPLMNCECCVHMRCNKDGGHCYMFAEKPNGKFCGRVSNEQAE